MQKRGEYQTMFETVLWSTYFFEFLRRFLVREKLPPTHINTPKTHQLHHIRRVFVHRYAYLRSTTKGPADSIPSDEAIRAGRKALVAARKLP